MVDFAPTHVFVDGSSFLYRAYYSSVRSDFRNSKGEPV
jgi:5'-3' exonuclease